MTPFFASSFVGTGDLSTNPPTAGGAWVAGTGVGQDVQLIDLVLDGAGNVTLHNISGWSNGQAQLTGSSGLPNAGAAFTMQITCTATDVNHGGNAAFLQLFALDAAFKGGSIAIQASHTAGAMAVSLNASSTLDGSSNSGNVGASVSYGAAHTYLLSVSADRTTYALAIDGATVATHTLAHAPGEPVLAGLIWSDGFHDRFSVADLDCETAPPPIFWTRFVKTDETL